MHTDKIVMILLLGALLVLAPAGGLQAANTVAPMSQANLQSEVTIPYPGHLTDAQGQAVADGAYTFSFTIYSQETGGETLWTETQPQVAVQNGTFLVQLGSQQPLLPAVLQEQRWLAVAVRGPGETDFTLLTPRLVLQNPQLPAAATAASSCPHNHIGESWSASGTTRGLYIGSGNAYALQAWSRNNIGLLGISTDLAIVMPSGQVGVVGIGNDTGVRGSGSVGVYGIGGTGDGVWGETSAGNKSGVYGYNDGAGAGIAGRSRTGYAGFFGGMQDNNDLALGGNVGRINNDPANPNADIYISSNNDLILKIDNDGNGAGTKHFYFRSGGGTDVCNVDNAGNLSCLGAKSAVVETQDYGWRRLYAQESPVVTFEDFGSAVLAGGRARVNFEPIFAQTVNLQEAYQVFLTPVCQQAALLFVTAKDTRGFTVQGVELDGQPSACGFDYRIVARRLGYEQTRLQPVEPARQESEP